MASTGVWSLAPLGPDWPQAARATWISAPFSQVIRALEARARIAWEKGTLSCSPRPDQCAFLPGYSDSRNKNPNSIGERYAAVLPALISAPFSQVIWTSIPRARMPLEKGTLSHYSARISAPFSAVIRALEARARIALEKGTLSRLPPAPGC